jgi:hypothetical protein
MGPVFQLERARGKENLIETEYKDAIFVWRSASCHHIDAFGDGGRSLRAACRLKEAQ